MQVLDAGSAGLLDGGGEGFGIGAEAVVGGDIQNGARLQRGRVGLEVPSGAVGLDLGEEAFGSASVKRAHFFGESGERLFLFFGLEAGGAGIPSGEECDG